MSDEKFRALFEHSSDAHLIFDAGGITDCNEAAVKLLRARHREDLIGLDPATLAPPLQPDGTPSGTGGASMNAIARERGWHRFEWIHQRMDGSTLPVEVTLNPIEVDGRPAMVAVWHDLSERKRDEQELVRKTDELRSANARMRRDLEAAAAVQRALLPQRLPRVPGWRFAWAYRPCVELAGDLLNVFELDERHVGLYVLDVTGHGVSSALLSVAISHFLSPVTAGSFFRIPGRESEGLAAPVDVARRLNTEFTWRPGMVQMFTMFLGIIDLETRTLRFVSAGHAGAVRVSGGGRTEVLGATSMPIGVLDDAAFEERVIELKPKDRVFVASDGILDAKSPDGDRIGLGGLAETLRGSRQLSLERAVDRVIEVTTSWCHPSSPADDVSLLALELR